MPSEIDLTKWSGEGSFTQTVIDRLRDLEQVRFVRVEDAPATRSDADYNFISNEVFVEFATAMREEPVKRFGILPATRIVPYKPDYSDEGMLQYLRAERIVPPYQTRGYKLVELVRIYEAGGARGAG